MHVRQAAARQARLQFRQTLFRHVERIQAAGIAHDRAQRQRLAAGAGAKIDDHLAALGADDLRQQLAAFVLHLDRTVLEQRQILQRRLFDDANAQGRKRRRLAQDRRLRQFGNDFLARRFQRIDAQVQRRRLVQRLRQFQRGRFAVARDQFIVQP